MRYMHFNSSCSFTAVAKHLLSLGIDARLKAGDVTLVNDIKQININGTERNFYFFASKYCSHHNPLDYPIYDSYGDVASGNELTKQFDAGGRKIGLN